MNFNKVKPTMSVQSAALVVSGSKLLEPTFTEIMTWCQGQTLNANIVKRSYLVRLYEATEACIRLLQ